MYVRTYVLMYYRLGRIVASDFFNQLVRGRRVEKLSVGVKEGDYTCAHRHSRTTPQSEKNAHEAEAKSEVMAPLYG